MARPRHIPDRRCVACGNQFPKHELHRVVRTPDGLVMVDPSGKRAGRGAYLCKSLGCWERGVSRAGLERSLGVSISGDTRNEIMDYYHRVVAGQSLVEG